LNNDIRERAIKIGEHILKTRDTIRKTGTKFGVTRSTVYRDITERLPLINYELAKQVLVIIEYNKTVRHLRGGEATRRKYKEHNNSLF
jgi:putative DeoR family transcriptional regulator, stage III sporulation protein D